MNFTKKIFFIKLLFMTLFLNKYTLRYSFFSWINELSVSNVSWIVSNLLFSSVSKFKIKELR